MLYNQSFRDRVLGMLMLLVIVSITSYAQSKDTETKTKGSIVNTNTDTSIAQNEKKQTPATKSSHIPVEVLAVYSYSKNDTSLKRSMASIGDIIVVRVSNIDSLMRRAKCKDSTGNELSVSTCKPQEIRLFINGRMMKGVHPEDGAPQLNRANGEGELQFRLDRNQENDKIWEDILGSPPLFNSRAFVEPVNISIGLENDYAIAPKNTKANQFNMERIHKGWFWLCLIGSIFYIILLILLTKNYGLLRDRGIDMRTTGLQPLVGTTFSAPPLDPPYSLGRLQMAFWFTIVVMSFLFIWLITDAYNILTASVLGLIGISGVTALSAAVIDNNKTQELINETKDLQVKVGDPATSQQELSQLKDKIQANIKTLTPTKSQGFFTDILQDINGISFHRLQMLVWTVVLGLLFIYTVWKRLSMPDFDPTLLALTGITAGTYLGFKFPEKQS